MLISQAATRGAFYIGKSFNLAINSAQVIFVLIYFIGLVGLLIFVTFASPLLIIKDLKFKDSIKSSIKLVKKEYLATLGLSTILFILFFLINKIPGIIGEILEYAVIVPYLSIILTRFVIISEDKK